MEHDVEQGVKTLISIIRESETYQNYQRCEQELSKQPELRDRIDRFRRDVFQMNLNDQIDLYEEADRLEQESMELRLNPVANDFLASELEMCRLLKEVNGIISDEVGVRLPEL